MQSSILVFYIKCLYIAFYAAGCSAYRRYEESYSKGGCKAEAKEPWSYRLENGPEFWGYDYPQCKGKFQSPIAISSRDAIYDPLLAKLVMLNYDIPVDGATIENTGRTVQITPTDDVERAVLVKKSKFKLELLHFHWGDKYYRGSEHIINGIQYALEMHLVHRTADGQVAVVAVLFQEQSEKNEELQKIISYLPKVMFNGTRSELTSKLNLGKLLPPKPTSFYRYQGSLTTPECDEGVRWFVLTYPLPVGKKQMAEFRKVYATKKSQASWKCKMSNNFRPIQPLNNRKVYVSK